MARKGEMEWGANKYIGGTDGTNISQKGTNMFIKMGVGFHIQSKIGILKFCRNFHPLL